MSAADIQLVTIVVPNPLFDSSKTAQVINTKYAFSQRITSQFQTLSSTNPQNLDPIEGLLYVPELPDDAATTCATALSLIPANATGIDDFPNGQDYPLVAFFPWTSIDCTQEFLAAARADAARAVITYLPNNTGGLDPPNPSDNAWSLNDDGRWKKANQYPVYAVTSINGPNFLNQLSLYSGNMSQAPNSQQLVANYPPRDFPRVFAHIDIQGGSQVPSLWIFLIIVLAVLLGIVIVASIVMHFIQRHQRRVLQRRLERGEVDLETLGIKKMNVPQNKIDEMPKYVFTQAVEAPAVPAAVPTSPTKSTKQTPAAAPTASFSQDTCAICLDEFTPGESEVRELPCKHIFHPECIDVFLRDNSSLCPMCKKSALPVGYIPVKVTNMMVRRERIVRRMRERRRANMLAAEGRLDDGPPPSRAKRLTTWVRRAFHPSAPPPYVAELTNRGQADTTTTPEALEAGQAPQPLGARRQTMAVPSDVENQGEAARRAWRRERLALQLHEQYASQAERTRQADEGRPLWRRIVGRVAPGLD